MSPTDRPRLSIAVLAHVRHPIAMPFRGGMEAHSWHLVKGLRARGHRVTLLASGDSDPELAPQAIVSRHYEADMPWATHRGGPGFTRVLRDIFREADAAIAAGDFDIVHNNALHHRPLLSARRSGQPMLTSLHVPPFDRLARAVRHSARPWSRMTVTSRRQLQSWWPQGAPDTAHVVHNGLDLSRHPFASTGNGEAVWAGRITANKGPALAAEAAALAGVPLTLFGEIEDAGYFNAELRPRLTGDIRYGGLLDSEALAAAMRQASVCLFTPMWDEPFGLVAIEAMAGGVPVAAFDSGAAREVIGSAGRFAQPGDVRGLADALMEATTIPRAEARARVEAHFSLDAMLDGYEALYRVAIAKGSPASAAAASSPRRIAEELA